MSILRRSLLLLVVISLLRITSAGAHELRPGYLEIREKEAETYHVRFKVPARGDLRLGLHLRLPQTCSEVEPTRRERTGNAFVDRLVTRCRGGLAGETIRIGGLSGTFTDVIARVSLAQGSVQSARLAPDRPYFVVTGTPSWQDTARTYFLLGVEHILLGVDHLLFVLALLLLINRTWALLKAITAFTAAHSITLVAASLGWAQAPQAPVEALIALSIAFAAAEIPLRPGRPADLLRRAPWAAAFGFGLLHGFGFGGALREIGLPQTDVPPALLTFNLGVEAGQVVFIGAVLLSGAAARKVGFLAFAGLRTAAAYGIGSVAAFWFIQRLAAIA